MGIKRGFPINQQEMTYIQYTPTLFQVMKLCHSQPFSTGECRTGAAFWVAVAGTVINYLMLYIPCFSFSFFYKVASYLASCLSIPAHRATQGGKARFSTIIGVFNAAQHQINMYDVILNLLNLLNNQCKCLISGTGDQKERSWSVLPRKHSPTSNTKEIIKIVQIIRSQAFSDVLLYTWNAKAETPIAVHVQQYLSFINIVLTMKWGIDVPFYQGWLPLICNM